MNRIVLKKVLATLISATCLLLFLVPYSLVFYTGDEGAQNDGWELSYVFEDFVLTMIYFPFAILWVIYLLRRKRLFRKIVKFALISLSIIYLFMAFLSLAMIAQDFMPYVGVYVSILLFPLLLGYLVNDQNLNRGK